MFIVALAIKVLSEYNSRYACKNVRVHVIHVLESHIQFRQRYMYRTGTLNCEKFNHLGVQFKGIHVHMYVIEMYIAKKTKTCKKCKVISFVAMETSQQTQVQISVALFLNYVLIHFRINQGLYRYFWCVSLMNYVHVPSSWHGHWVQCSFYYKCTYLICTLGFLRRSLNIQTSVIIKMYFCKMKEKEMTIKLALIF